MRLTTAIAATTLYLSAACHAAVFDINTGDDSARTPVTGAAGGAAAQNESRQLERCERTMGTLAVVEDQQARWYYQLRNEYNLQSTVPLIRLLIQQSNCFVIVERGRAMQNMMQERALEQSGEIRAGSNFGKGQIAAADYTLNPMITFSSRDSGGVGGAFGGIARGFFGSAGAIVGAVAGSLKFREAATTLMLVDNRSGVQLAAAEGAASKTDFGAWGGVFGGGVAGGAGGYTNTPEGKVLAGAFADAYNQLVRAVKSYKAQEVEGGLGTGGTLGVQGGTTPASQRLK